MINDIVVFVILAAIVALVYFQHKSVVKKSAVNIASQLNEDEAAVRRHWSGKSNQEHWLFKTSFPNAIKYEANAALNHELQQVQVARRLYAQSSASRQAVASN
jgi:hypothetical protein